MKVLLICAALLGSALAAKLQPQQQQQLPLPAEEEEVFPPQPYNFGFEVRDDETTNYQNRAEVADAEGRVKGSYSYVLPDGYVYTVTYEDQKDGNGLQVSVKKEPSGIEVIIPEQNLQDKKHNLVKGNII